MTIIIFLIILGLLILSHEFGHFVVAKRGGVRVDEFGLGFPPRLFGFKRGETTYSLNLIPFGGFVKIYGEDPAPSETKSLTGADLERVLYTKSKWLQAVVLVAGVVANLVLAWLLLIFAFTTTGLPTAAETIPAGYSLENQRVTIVHLEPKSPAFASGLAVGDQIVSLRTIGDRLSKPTIETIQTFVANHPDSEIVVGYIRAQGSRIKPTIAERAVHPTPLGPTGQPALGVGLETIGTLHLPILRAIIAGTQSLWHLLSSVLVGFSSLLASLFTGQSQTLSQITGPVGLVSLVGDASALGLGYLLFFTALLSINLAVLNLLPIPALDGGRLFLLLIETSRGRMIKPKIANALNLGGFALLMFLMLLVTYNDIIKLLV